MTFTRDVNKFLKSAKDSLKDEDAPAVGALKAIAKVLDEGEISGNILAQYRLFYTALQKKVSAQKVPQEDDSLFTPED